MPLTLMSNPVCFAFKGLRLHAFREAASERLHIFMNVLGPIRWFLKLLHLETNRTLELRRQSTDRRERNAWRELRCSDGSFACNVWLIATLTKVCDSELSLSSFSISECFVLLQQDRLAPKRAAKLSRFAVSIGNRSGMLLL